VKSVFAEKQGQNTQPKRKPPPSTGVGLRGCMAVMKNSFLPFSNEKRGIDKINAPLVIPLSHQIHLVKNRSPMAILLHFAAIFDDNFL
jgi:hypothetical protein